MISVYLQNLVKVLGVGAAFASLPFFASLAELQPPWPPAIGFVSAALVLVGALIVWEWNRKTRIRNRRRAILRATAVTVTSLLIYLALFSLFTQPMVDRPREVIGYECTQFALTAYRAPCSEIPGSAIARARGEAERIWTARSITVVRLGLNVAWLSFTVGLIMAMGAVLAGRKF